MLKAVAEAAIEFVVITAFITMVLVWAGVLGT